MPILSAATSSTRSISCVASGRPAPRYAPMVVLFVITVVALEPHVRDLVHADRHHLGEHRQDGADARVGAGRGHDGTVEADDLAVGVHAELGRHHEVAAVHERDHVLRAGLDPLHRAAELQRGRGGGDEVLDVRRRLRAEAAADPRAHDAQLRRVRDRASGRTPAWMACGAWCETQHVRPPSPGTARMPLVSIGNAGQALTHHRDLGDHVGADERVGVALRREVGAEAHVRAVLGEQQRGIGRQRVERRSGPTATGRSRR